MGETMVEIGSSFVGTTYTPRTLEVDGPERLVINLRELDCVTFVENVLVLSRFVHRGDPSILANDDHVRSEYRSLLTEIRYRSGVIAGYPSRLHYFSGVDFGQRGARPGSQRLSGPGRRGGRHADRIHVRAH